MGEMVIARLDETGCVFCLVLRLFSASTLPRRTVSRSHSHDVIVVDGGDVCFSTK